MIAAFDLMSWYKIKTKNFPDASVGLFNEKEATIEYLIRLGDQHNLNMGEMLNHKGRNGTTLFDQAAYFSKNLAKMLLQRNVKVNTVDHKFMIPIFRVSQIF